jgi:hypothetical protein
MLPGDPLAFMVRSAVLLKIGGPGRKLGSRRAGVGCAQGDGAILAFRRLPDL